jgi:hypothetical protein
MPQVFFLWREETDVEHTPERIGRILEAGDDVGGLADLPIREMLDRIRHEFPGAQESAGMLTWKSGSESFRITWTWQFLRVEADSLSDEHREKFIDLARSFHCPVYDVQMNLRMK